MAHINQGFNGVWIFPDITIIVQFLFIFNCGGYQLWLNFIQLWSRPTQESQAKVQM